MAPRRSLSDKSRGVVGESEFCAIAPLETIVPNLEQYIDRQRILGDFGELALRSDDLQEILTEACRLVGRALGTDLGKILEITPDRTQVLVRAGVGWDPAIVGTACFPLGGKTAESHSVELGQPVITTNIVTDDRYERPQFMRDAGVIVTINVPIRLPGGGIYGLLQVDSLKERDFDQEDVEFLRTYAMFLGPVIDRLHKVHSLREVLASYQRLLRELEHRVKNNIGVIRALVRVKAHEASSDETRAAMNDIGARIETLRLVHEQLYAAGGVESLSLRTYASKLVEGLHRLHHEVARSVALKVSIDDVDLATDTAMPLGLIVNEFVTNSFKYAFEGEAGQIEIEIKGIAEGTLRLYLGDNGKGMDIDAQHAGTGIDLIKGLSRQIGGKADFRSSSEGTSLVVEFPVH